MSPFPKKPISIPLPPNKANENKRTEEKEELNLCDTFG